MEFFSGSESDAKHTVWYLLATTIRCGADLIVLRIRGLDTVTAVASRVERATVHDVVAHAPCPVLTVRGWKLRHELATSSLFTRVAMIKKVKAGYKVLSSKGKNMGGPYKTLEAAKKRLRQAEFSKHSK